MRFQPTCACHTLGRRGLLAAAVASLAAPALAQPAAPPDPALVDELALANRILADQGVVDGFGHISVRHDKAPGHYLLARSMAPALVAPGDIMEYDADSSPVDPRGRASYLERFIHGEIYRARPDVMAVVHNHSPGLIPFGVAGAALRPVYHLAGFLGGGVPVFEIRDTAGPATNLLVSNNSYGRALAGVLASHPVALMRGHGAVVVGSSIKQAVFRAVYTEVNARLQAEAQRLGTVNFLTDEEAAAASKTNDGLIERPWELWRRHAQAS